MDSFMNGFSWFGRSFCWSWDTGDESMEELSWTAMWNQNLDVVAVHSVHRGMNLLLLWLMHCIVLEVLVKYQAGQLLASRFTSLGKDVRWLVNN
jgi:hypothetical protein